MEEINSILLKKGHSKNMYIHVYPLTHTHIFIFTLEKVTELINYQQWLNEGGKMIVFQGQLSIIEFLMKNIGHS